MADITAILKAFRNELILRGIVRHPSNAGPLPPLFVEPHGQAPAPGEREGPEDDANLLITASFSGDLPETSRDAYRRRTIIDVRYRSKGNGGLQRARAVDAQVFDVMAHREDYALGWVMAEGDPAELAVLETGSFAALGRIGADPAYGFDELAKYYVEALR